ncbi:ABC transporter ATP-binding protein [Candidatus Endowatersipora endosymbiont of Watersipora subatra]|uniref:ABC transporter ATP-binding protein n=1 Tax=Candidatus Endowatersipora endosymbiont of Watersipora subatra TaxID=3077946 RepID=UPI00312C8C27
MNRQIDLPKEPFAQFEMVTKKYGAVTAVDQVSLDIFEKEFFALLGPSGCGKTTLMRMLAGFETVTEGRILLQGKDLKKIPPWKRPINMMFQSYALFPHMNVESNIAFGLKQEDMLKGEIEDRVEKMLQLVKMENFAQRKPNQLSGGQRQRVALARSLAKQPKLLLLDEPLGALDRKLREETQFELMELQEKLGITFMIVTHDQEEAMTVADRIAIMDNGKIAQIGPPSKMYENPNSSYVADFLGDINLLSAKVMANDNGIVCLEIEGGDVARVECSQSYLQGDTVWFANRPEKFSISRKQPSINFNSFAGEVWDIAYLGCLTIYKVKLDNGNFAKVSVLNHDISNEDPIIWEDRVWLSFLPDAAFVLNQ